MIVYGRRRVGKSTMLHQALSRSGDLYLEALRGVSQRKQIEHFLRQLADQSKTPLAVARDWREAFQVLTFHIANRKRYVVFDEFPWMASGRTELVSLLKYFWDNHWKENLNLTLVVCGSVASFMLRHIVHSHGWSHTSRSSRRIHGPASWIGWLEVRWRASSGWPSSGSV